MMLND